MLRILGRALFWGVGAYAVGVVAGILLVWAFSGNRHDKDLEMAMTGFFFTGPMAGGLGSIVSLLWPGRAKSPIKSADASAGRETWRNPGLGLYI